MPFAHRLNLRPTLPTVALAPGLVLLLVLAAPMAGPIVGPTSHRTVASLGPATSLHPSADRPAATTTSVFFGVNASYNGTFTFSLGFNASVELTGGDIDAGSQLFGTAALTSAPQTRIGISAIGLSAALPVPAIGQYGPVKVPGASFNYFGQALGVEVETVAYIHANLLADGGGAALNWSTAPANFSFGVTAHPGEAGRTIYANLTDLQYFLSVALYAVGNVPILGNVNLTLVPPTPLAIVFGDPKEIDQEYHVVAPPSIQSFAANPNPVQVGSSTQLSAAATGGSGPLSYLYPVLPTGCTSSNTASLACTPSGVGNYTVEVRVTDPQGFNATASTTLAVAEHVAGSGAGSDLGPYLLPIGLVAAGAAVVGAYFLGRRGHRKPPTPLQRFDAT